MQIRVIARCVLSLPIALAACTSNNDTTGTQNTGPQFMILGNDMSARLQNVYITLNNAAKPGLTVTVNGTALTNTSGGQYFGGLPAALATGAAIQLVVTDGTNTATGNSIVPALPVITSATVASHGAPVVVAWSSATSPDSFQVSLNYHLPDSSAVGVTMRLAGSARQVSIPQTDIPANGVVYSIGLQGMMNGTFTGAAAAGSRMNVRADVPSYPFTVP